MGDELCTRAQTRTVNTLCHEYVVHGDELVILLNVSGRLQVAGGHERPRHANLSIAGIFCGHTVDENRNRGGGVRNAYTILLF